MKTRNIFLAAALTLILTGCWNRPKSPDPVEPDVQTFSFEELYGIFSQFGENIMSEYFASAESKQKIEPDLRQSWESMVEFEEACNTLSYDYVNGEGCADGFTMACYRYKANVHVLVVLMEMGGCDVSSVKYIRAYEYDPEQKNAHEIPLPFEPAPKYEDFNDILTLAGGPVAELREAMTEGRYLYMFDTQGALVYLNTLDLYEEGSRGGYFLRYNWDGSVLARDEDYPKPCITDEGFAQILLGQHAPDFLHVGGDTIGYKIVYSPEGACFVISLDGKEVMIIQEDEWELVESIEVFSPKYSVPDYIYGEEAGQPHVGAKFNECLGPFNVNWMTVWLLADGTVRLDTEPFIARISYTTTSDQMDCPLPAIPSDDIKVQIPNPKFKDTATIQSIIISKK